MAIKDIMALLEGPLGTGAGGVVALILLLFVAKKSGQFTLMAISGETLTNLREQLNDLREEMKKMHDKIEELTTDKDELREENLNLRLENRELKVDWMALQKKLAHAEDDNVRLTRHLMKHNIPIPREAPAP